MSEDAEDLGPLPKSSQTHILEKLSLRALSNVLPADTFLLRDERIDDTGVDVSLELLHKGSYTNMRSQVQIKSTEKYKPNQDGSISFSADTSNINYLLNGTSPLYILYIHETKQLRYVWLRDEVLRLNRENSQWMDQEKNTLYFINALDEAALPQIYTRIKSEAKLARGLHDILGRSTIQEEVVIHIDPNTLQLSDSDEIYALLLKSGLAIVTSGYAHIVLQLVDKLTTSQRSNPRVHVVIGYAKHTVGDYHAALSSISKAALSRSQLSDYDQQFADYLKDSCDFQVGRITLEEYMEKRQNLTNNPKSIFRLEAKLEYVRQQMLKSVDFDSARELYKEVARTVQEIVQASDNAALTLQTKLIDLYLRGAYILQYSLRATLWSEIGETVNLPPNQAVVKEVDLNWIKWLEEMREVINATAEANHPLLFAGALDTYVKIQSIRISSDLLRSETKVIDPDNNIIKGLKAVCIQAIEIYQRLDQLERELHVRLILADLYVMTGERDKANEVAQAVIPQANAMDYIDLEETATAILSGTSSWDNTVNRMERSDTEDQDISWSQRTDEEMKKAALDWIRGTQLPMERLLVIEQGWIAGRDIAREKVHWCRHIELHEQLRHMQSKETMYARFPLQSCHCALHQYRSRIEHEHWPSVIQAFKEAWCKTCPDRSPKIAEE